MFVSLQTTGACVVPGALSESPRELFKNRTIQAHEDMAECLRLAESVTESVKQNEHALDFDVRGETLTLESLRVRITENPKNLYLGVIRFDPNNYILPGQYACTVPTCRCCRRIVLDSSDLFKVDLWTLALVHTLRVQDRIFRVERGCERDGYLPLRLVKVEQEEEKFPLVFSLDTVWFQASRFQTLPEWFSKSVSLPMPIDHYRRLKKALHNVPLRSLGYIMDVVLGVNRKTGFSMCPFSLAVWSCVIVCQMLADKLGDELSGRTKIFSAMRAWSRLILPADRIRLNKIDDRLYVILQEDLLPLLFDTRELVVPTWFPELEHQGILEIGGNLERIIDLVEQKPRVLEDNLDDLKACLQALYCNTDELRTILHRVYSDFVRGPELRVPWFIRNYSMEDYAFHRLVLDSMVLSLPVRKGIIALIDWPYDEEELFDQRLSQNTIVYYTNEDDTPIAGAGDYRWYQVQNAGSDNVLKLLTTHKPPNLVVVCREVEDRLRLYREIPGIIGAYDPGIFRAFLHGGRLGLITESGRVLEAPVSDNYRRIYSNHYPEEADWASDWRETTNYYNRFIRMRPDWFCYHLESGGILEREYFCEVVVSEMSILNSRRGVLDFKGGTRGDGFFSFVVPMREQNVYSGGFYI